MGLKNVLHLVGSTRGYEDRAAALRDFSKEGLSWEEKQFFVPWLRQSEHVDGTVEREGEAKTPQGEGKEKGDACHEQVSRCLSRMDFERVLRDKHRDLESDEPELALNIRFASQSAEMELQRKGEACVKEIFEILWRLWTDGEGKAGDGVHTHIRSLMLPKPVQETAEGAGFDEEGDESNVEDPKALRAFLFVAMALKWAAWTSLLPPAVIFRGLVRFGCEICLLGLGEREETGDLGKACRSFAAEGGGHYAWWQQAIVAVSVFEGVGKGDPSICETALMQSAEGAKDVFEELVQTEGEKNTSASGLGSTRVALLSGGFVGPLLRDLRLVASFARQQPGARGKGAVPCVLPLPQLGVQTGGVPQTSKGGDTFLGGEEERRDGGILGGKRRISEREVGTGTHSGVVVVSPPSEKRHKARGVHSCDLIEKCWWEPSLGVVRKLQRSHALSLVLWSLPKIEDLGVAVRLNMPPPLALPLLFPSRLLFISLLTALPSERDEEKRPEGSKGILQSGSCSSTLKVALLLIHAAMEAAGTAEKREGIGEEYSKWERKRRKRNASKLLQSALIPHSDSTGTSAAALDLCACSLAMGVGDVRLLSEEALTALQSSPNWRLLRVLAHQQKRTELNSRIAELVCFHTLGLLPKQADSRIREELQPVFVVGRASEEELRDDPQKVLAVWGGSRREVSAADESVELFSLLRAGVGTLVEEKSLDFLQNGDSQDSLSMLRQLMEVMPFLGSVRPTFSPNSTGTVYEKVMRATLNFQGGGVGRLVQAVEGLFFRLFTEDWEVLQKEKEKGGTGGIRGGVGEGGIDDGGSGLARALHLFAWVLGFWTQGGLPPPHTNDAFCEKMRQHTWTHTVGTEGARGASSSSSGHIRRAGDAATTALLAFAAVQAVRAAAVAGTLDEDSVSRLHKLPFACALEVASSDPLLHGDRLCTNSREDMGGGSFLLSLLALDLLPSLSCLASSSSCIPLASAVRGRMETGISSHTLETLVIRCAAVVLEDWNEDNSVREKGNSSPKRKGLLESTEREAASERWRLLLLSRSLEVLSTSVHLLLGEKARAGGSVAVDLRPGDYIKAIEDPTSFLQGLPARLCCRLMETGVLVPLVLKMARVSTQIFLGKPVPPCPPEAVEEEKRKDAAEKAKTKDVDVEMGGEGEESNVQANSQEPPEERAVRLWLFEKETERFNDMQTHAVELLRWTLSIAGRCLSSAAPSPFLQKKSIHPSSVSDFLHGLCRAFIHPLTCASTLGISTHLSAHIRLLGPLLHKPVHLGCLDSVLRADETESLEVLPSLLELLKEDLKSTLRKVGLRETEGETKRGEDRRKESVQTKDISNSSFWFTCVCRIVAVLRGADSGSKKLPSSAQASPSVEHTESAESGDAQKEKEKKGEAEEEKDPSPWRLGASTVKTLVASFGDLLRMHVRTSNLELGVLLASVCPEVSRLCSAHPKRVAEELEDALEEVLPFLESRLGSQTASDGPAETSRGSGGTVLGGGEVGEGKETSLLSALRTVNGEAVGDGKGGSDGQAVVSGETEKERGAGEGGYAERVLRAAERTLLRELQSIKRSTERILNA
uniref:Uncharacterized protein n=1 Tax=Chromera velia CCMP2878 TaxID=1169474 RepID=A0A0K6S7P7_9ALVE|eukprot:Cvel_22730.t1-p1 / transcript=Cvel_22730.t1 / gene=Cvel_22730 / organism=Chromera_velia_CCMP2878 / gene_product=hypothetical protein / transcript_product=hypothetical protein / location=Cvel_scaffold2266:2298-16695(+) / protein_length=1570 / sequence_SO=supercontig / SO=protein_coding / is_pseudo=false